MSKIKIFSLGGLNENAKNMYVVEVDNDLFVFDAGLKYADENMLGIDYIIPNIDYLKANVNRIKGLFLTHGHDENIGAIPDLVLELPNINIYGAKFTIDLVKKELEEEGISFNNLHEIKAHKTMTFGDINIFPISLTHSIPDNVGYALYTNDGIIFYANDFVFDSTMRGPYGTDIGKLAYVGKQGVLCLLTESLYADRIGHTSPNHRISSLIKETLNHNEKRIIYNVLSAHLYRIQELFNEVSKTNRKIIIMGKRLQNTIKQAIEANYITVNNDIIGDLSNINDEGAVIIVSNEREKPFANLERIVNGYDKYIKLTENDTIFMAIPIHEGMEKTFVDIADGIARLGANMVMLSGKKYLSHHASREDLMLMIDLMKPKYYFPVKGEYRFQVANAEVAEEVGIPKENILLKQIGDVVLFENGNLKECFDKVPHGTILIDGKSMNDVGELVLKDRELLSDNGIVIICTTISKKTKKVIAGPEVLTRGFIYVKDNADLIKGIQTLCIKIIEENIQNNYIEYNKIKNSTRDELGKYLYKETECKPMIITVIQEI